MSDAISLTVGSRLTIDRVEYVVSGYSGVINRDGRSIRVSLKDVALAENRSLQITDSAPVDISIGADLTIDDVTYICTSMEMIRDNGGRGGTLYAKDPLLAQRHQMEEEQRAEMTRLFAQHMKDEE